MVCLERGTPSLRYPCSQRFWVPQMVNMAELWIPTAQQAELLNDVLAVMPFKRGDDGLPVGSWDIGHGLKNWCFDWDTAGPTLAANSGPGLMFRKRGHKTKAACKELLIEGAQTLLTAWRKGELETAVRNLGDGALLAVEKSSMIVEEFPNCRLQLWSERLGEDRPIMVAVLGDNLIVGADDEETKSARWCELDVPTSDCKLSAADAAYIAEVVARMGGASFTTKKLRKGDRKWLDLACMGALLLCFSRSIKMDGRVYQHQHLI
eukprot:Skav203091  [mRNA]  locus=scaffold447:158382:159328:+ [translate_table: standard]